MTILARPLHPVLVRSVLVVWIVLMAHAWVHSQSPVVPSTYKGAPLFTAFISGRLPDAKLLGMLPEGTREVYRARLAKRAVDAAYLSAPPAADLDGKDALLIRPQLESAIVAVIGRSGARADAVAFAAGVPQHYGWEGYSEPILAEATWAEQFRAQRGRSAIDAYVDLFLLERYRAAFEAAVEKGEEAVQDFAALRYRAVLAQALRNQDPLIRALAAHIDRAAYAYIDSGRHPRAR